jgi:hypothetical protein
MAAAGAEHAAPMWEEGGDPGGITIVGFAERFSRLALLDA